MIGAVVSIFALGASILIRGSSLNVKDELVTMDREEMDLTGSPSSVLV
jgi:hypothetical protein